MAAHDDNEVWDERDRQAGVRPVEGSPGGSKWIIGIVVGGIVILGSAAVAVYFVIDFQPPPNPPMVGFNPPGGIAPPPPGFPGGIGGDTEWSTADAKTREEIRAALLALGKELRKPDFDPTTCFDVNFLAESGKDAVLPDVGWGNKVILPDAGAPPLDHVAVTRTLLKERRRDWRRLEWANPDIRKVTVTNGGLGMIARAVVWGKQPQGPTSKTLWTFTRDLNDKWVVTDWEDIASGLRGSHEIALELIRRTENRWDLYTFRQLPGVHAAIEDGRIDSEQASLTRLFQTRPLGVFADLANLAEAKFQSRQYGSARAAELINEMAERWLDRPCMLRLRAELGMAVNSSAITIDACEIYTRLYGNDPDMQSWHAAALIATGRLEKARPLVTASLADVPGHLESLNSYRKLCEKADVEQFIIRATASNRFPDLYPTLVRRANLDGDQQAVIRLAEEFIARRPEDPSGPEGLIRALAQKGEVVAALDQYIRYAPQLPEYSRSGLRYSIATKVVESGTATDFLAKLPDELRDEFFLALAYNLESWRGGEPDKGVGENKRKQLAELVAAFTKLRPGQPAVLIYEAKLLIREKQWETAEKKLDTVQLPPSNEEDLVFNSLDWLLQGARRDVWYALRKWDAAVDDGKSSASNFHAMANRCESDKKWDDLAALIEVYRKRKPDPLDLSYWNGTRFAGQGKHAEAMAELKKVFTNEKRPVFDSDEDDDRPGYHPLARAKFVRSAIKFGKVADAMAALEALDYPPPALFAYVVAMSGDHERAIRYMDGLVEDNAFFAKQLYADPDLGPLLKKPEFAAFRGRHPPEEMPPDDD